LNSQSLLEGHLALVRKDNLRLRYEIGRGIPGSLVEGLEAVERIVISPSQFNFNFRCQHCHLCFFLASLNVLLVVKLEEIVFLRDLALLTFS